MIKIIRGTYGYVDKDGVVSPKTSKDAPFELDKDKEARLVDQGVAEYVESEEEPAKAPAKKQVKKVVKKSKEADEDEPPVISAADPE